MDEIFRLFKQATVPKHYYTTSPKEPPGQGGYSDVRVYYLKRSSSLVNHDRVVMSHPRKGENSDQWGDKSRLYRDCERTASLKIVNSDTKMSVLLPM